LLRRWLSASTSPHRTGSGPASVQEAFLVREVLRRLVEAPIERPYRCSSGVAPVLGAVFVLEASRTVVSFAV
jgi:hypothetical protein